MSQIPAVEPSQPEWSLASELFLLLTTDAGHRAGFGTQRGIGLAAAALADLVDAGRLDLDTDSDPRVLVVDAQPMGSVVLDPVLRAVAEHRSPTLSGLLRDRTIQGERRVADDLVRRSIIEHRSGPAGLFSRYPVVDPVPEQRVRGRLVLLLTSGTGAVRDVTLLAILRALNVEHTVLRADVPLGRRELRDRIASLAESSEMGAGVEQALRRLHAAIAASASIGVTTGG